MSEYTRSSDNSLEIIQPFIDRIADADDVQIMGGLGTAAFLQSVVEIDTNAKEVIIPDNLYLSAHRDDGTKRDVDVLVLSSDQSRVQEVDDLLFDSIGDSLERSVFGIHPNEALERQRANPLGFRAFRTFLSDRYEDSAHSSGAYLKSLFPFAVPLDPETLETWTLVMGKEETRIPISHPGATLANYTNRSISGLRPRDKEKIAQVAENVFALAPEIRDWMLDGPGKSQIELSTAIASLRRPSEANMSLIHGIPISTHSHDDLVELPSFMNPEYSHCQKRSIIGRSVLKAHALHAFESSPAIIKLWHQFAERKVDAIVKNT